MVGGTLLKVLKSLVDCDQAITSLDTLIIEKKEVVEKNTKIIEELEKKIAELNTEVHAKKKEADFQNLQSRELKDKEDSKREQLEGIDNQKEYKALEREIEVLTRKRIELDEKLMKYWYKIEQDSKNNHDEVQISTEKVEQLQAQNKEYIDTINASEKQREQRSIERTERILQVPQEWRQRYERMRSSVDDPIVAVLSSSCGACYYSILKQDLTKLKKEEILLCRNCYRFLYFDQEEQTSY
jgi:hypothetical protein